MALLKKIELYCDDFLSYNSMYLCTYVTYLLSNFKQTRKGQYGGRTAIRKSIARSLE